MKLSNLPIVTSLFLSSSTFAASSLMGTGLDLSAGVSQKEGSSGYVVQLDWQFSDYAEFSLVGRSHLNGDQFTLEQVLPKAKLDALLAEAGTTKKLTPEKFSPRHNTVGADFTLRYPMDFSGFSIAPFFDVGSQQIRTKAVDLYFASTGGTGTGGTGGTGGTTNNSTLAHTISFDSFNALVTGAGIQFGMEEHQIRIGYHSYSTDESWSELQVLDDVAGMWLRYDYFFNESLAVRFMFDGADQFDQPTFDFGIRWRF